MKFLARIGVLMIALLFGAVSAEATTITIQSQQIPNFQYNSANGIHLRIFLNQAFVSSGGITYQPGSPGGGQWFSDTTCTIVGTTVTIPQLQIESTTDGIDSTTATYTAYFYDANGGKLGVYAGFDSFRVPNPIVSVSGCSPQGTCATWSDIRTYNNNRVYAPNNFSFTKDETIALINSAVKAGAGAKSTETFIVQQPDLPNIPNAQALNAFPVGTIPKIIANGVIAAAGSGDYIASLGVTAPITSTGGLNPNIGVQSSNLLVGVDLSISPNGTGVLLGTQAVTVSLGANVVKVNKANTFGAFLQTFQVGANLSLVDPTDNTKIVQVDASGLTTGNTRTVRIPDAASSPAQNFAAVSHQWLNSFSQNTGGFTASQPAFTDISGTLVAGQEPATTVNSFTNDTNIQVSGIAAQNATLAWAGLLSPARGGSGVNNGAFTITLGGNISIASSFTTSGASALTVTVTGVTNTTLPLGTTTVATNTLNNLGTTSINSDLLPSGAGARNVGSNALPWGTGFFGASATNNYQVNSPAATAARTVTFAADANSVTVVAQTAPANQFFNSLSSGGVLASAQVGFSNLSGNIAVGQLGTTLGPQFVAIGINTAAPSVGLLDAGRTLNTDADATVGSAEFDFIVTKNDTNTRTFPGLLVKPNLNPGPSNSNTTINVLAVDTINSAPTGLTVNLTKWSYGGTQKGLLDSSGNLTLAGALNNVVVTQPGSQATFTLAGGKTFTVNNSLTVGGVDGKTLTLNNTLAFSGTDSTTLTFQGTGTVVNRDSTDTLTGKTYDTGSTGNIFKINGTQITSISGNTAKVGSVSGSITTNDCVKFDASGNLVDNGSTCGSGGGSPGGSSGQLQYNNAGAFGGMAEWSYSTPGVTVTKNSLNTTLTDLLVATNTTASLSNQKQYSGAVHFSGTTWDNSIATAVSVTTDTRLLQGSSGANDSGFPSVTVTAASNATPIVVTTGSNHGFVMGEQVTVTGVNGNTAANGTFFVQVLSNTTFAEIGTTGNGAFAASPNGKVARPSLGWLGIATQYNGAGYNVNAGFDTNGHLFLGSNAPTTYSPASLQVTGPVYITSNAQGIPFAHLSQGPPTFEYSDFYLNVTSTPTFTGLTTGEYAMSSNLTMNSSGATDFGVAGYFSTLANKAGQQIWGVNPVVATSVVATLRSGEFDVNYNVAGNTPDTGNAGFGDGVDTVCGGTGNCSSAFAMGKGAGSNAWKVGLWEQNVGYTGYAGVDPSAVYGDSTNKYVYGLNLRTATFQANPANKISGMVAGPYGVPDVVSVNNTGVDVSLLQMGTLSGVNNVVQIGAPASVTTGASPIAALVVGLTSIFNGAIPPGITVQGTDATNGRINIASVGAPPQLLFFRGDGNSAGITAVAVNDILGNITHEAFDGSAWAFGASIKYQAAETWTNVPAHGVDIQVVPVPKGTGTGVESLRFMGMGPLQISNNASYAAATGPAAGDFIGGSQSAVAMYVHGSKFVIAYNRAGTVHFLTYDLAAGAGSWADGTTAP